MNPIHLQDLYQITRLIQKSTSLDIVVYEFHRAIEGESYSETSFEEFQKRSEPYYKTYVGYNIDDIPANIDHVVKVNGEWYVMLDTSSNYYLGSGPGSLLMLREICFNRSIAILSVESHVIEFLFDKFPEYKFPRHLNYFEFRNKYLEVKSTASRKTTKSKSAPQGKNKNKNKPEQDLIIKQREEFYTINANISKAKNLLQEKKAAVRQKTEPQLRDELLPLLKMRKNAYAEAKCGTGLSDLLFPSRTGKCKFIYECKMGVTQKKLQEALNQLRIKYIAHQDKFGGIIIFNKEDNFSQQLKKMPDFIEATGGKLVKINSTTSHDEEFECTYPRDGDVNDLITVFIFLVNLR